MNKVIILLKINKITLIKIDLINIINLAIILTKSIKLQQISIKILHIDLKIKTVIYQKMTRIKILNHLKIKMIIEIKTVIDQKTIMKLNIHIKIYKMIFKIKK